MDIILTNNQFIFFAFVILLVLLWFERKNIISVSPPKNKVLYILILFSEFLVILGSRFITSQISRALINNKSAYLLDIALFIIIILLVTKVGRYFKLMILMGGNRSVRMSDEQIQRALNKAWKYKKTGKYAKALKVYDKIYNALIKKAANHARKIDGTGLDEGKTRTITTKYFTEADKYLKQDNVACTILNNMGVIFAELGDKKTAKKYFEESVKLTPERSNYQDPLIGLKNLE